MMRDKAYQPLKQRNKHMHESSNGSSFSVDLDRTVTTIYELRDELRAQ